MNLVADENVDRPIVLALRQAGHEVSYIAEVDPSIPDEDVLESAFRDRALLLTADTDFGLLVYRQGRASHGVALLRMHGLSSTRKAAIIVQALEQHGDEMLGAMTVIGPGGLRLRQVK